MTYHVVVTRDGDGWIADVPALPGTHTWSKTLRPLDRRIREVIGMVEDLPRSAEAALDLEMDYRTGPLGALTSEALASWFLSRRAGVVAWRGESGPFGRNGVGLGAVGVREPVGGRAVLKPAGTAAGGGEDLGQLGQPRVVVVAAPDQRPRNGGAYRNRNAGIFTVRDGKIVSVREYTDTQHVAQVLL